MPMLRKQPFVKENAPPNLKPTDQVFHCKITNEIFTDYEKFFERIILCNSLVWTCSETGRTGLTFQEALDSEAKARKQIAGFPEALLKPVLYLASKTCRSRINDVVDDVFVFSRDRYFVNESVEVQHDGEKKMCKVMKVIASANKDMVEKEKPASDVIVLDSDEEEDVPLSKLQKNPKKDSKVSDFGNPPLSFQYVVQELKKPNIYIVEAKQVCRVKGKYNRDKCKFFLKKHCDINSDAIWALKKQSRKRYKIDTISWQDYFDGDFPKFGVTKAKKSRSGPIDLTNEEAMLKQAKKERKEKKKIEKEMKKMEKEDKKEIKKALKDRQRKQLKEEKKRLKALQEKEASERKTIQGLLREMVVSVSQRVSKEEVADKKAIQALLREMVYSVANPNRDEETLEEKLRKMSPDERKAFKEKMRQEQLAEKMKQKEELKKKWEEEKQRKKEERDKLREKKKAEELERREYLREYNKPREDIECDDLKPLPRPKPVQSRVPSEFFGDAVMILEFLTCFNQLLEMDDQFPHKITLDGLGEALADTKVNGLFADLISFLLTTIFQLEEEEEEYDEEDDIDKEEVEKLTEEESDGEPILMFNSQEAQQENVSFRDLVKQATIAAQIPQQNFGTPLNKLHIDGFTLTEILRLHFLASGAKGSERNNSFRYTQRGGYGATDDAGLEFKRQEAAVIKSLGEANMFDLNPGDKLKILTALVQQLMTYVACRDVIEENFDNLRATRGELRAHQWAETRREKDEATFWYKKRVEERAKEKEEKLKEKEQKKKGQVDQLKEDNVIDLCDSRSPSRGPDSQSNSRSATPTKGSPEDPKKGRPKGSGSKFAEHRHSDRLKDKGTDSGDTELPMENIEWDKITPDDRVVMRNRFEKKELELMEAISELQHSNAIHPIGRDRTFRRYWVFRSLTGVFVEDAEDQVPDCYYEDLRPQIKPEAESFNSNSLPLKGAGDATVAKDEKCGNSDKENESFDQNKAAAQVAMDTGDLSTKVISLDTDSSAMDTDTPDDNTKKTPEIIISDSSDQQKGVDESPPPKSSNLVSVHEQIRDRSKVRWSYFNSVEALDELIENLNPRGYREGPLKQALQEQRKFLVHQLPLCPERMLSISEQESAASSVRFQKVKSRNRNVQGAVKNASASEFLELNLREQLLDLEERVFVGGIGTLKVTTRMAWRDAIECGNYDPQCESVSWGSGHSVRVAARFKNANAKQNGDVKTENGLPENIKDEEDNDDLAILVVRDMSKALLQVCQMLEPRYLKPPLGEDEETRTRKQKEALELAFQGLTPRKIKAQIWEKKPKVKEENGEEGQEGEKEEADEEDTKKTAMERWQESLMNCCSLSQVFLHMSVLDNSIIWDKSALHARCKICRRKGDDEKMLLCDGCDSGYHMYCLKPPMKKIPKDDWYCSRCKPKDLVIPKMRRKSTFQEESEMSSIRDTEEEEEESSEEEEEESDEETEDESDEETDDYDEDTEVEGEEEQPAKIQLLKGFKGKGKKAAAGDSPGSSSSRGGSARSSRSNTPTRSTKNRTSLEKAIQMKAVAAKGGEKRKSSRHSIETEQPTSREPRSKSSRLSLEPRSANKRRSDVPSDELASSSSTWPKNRRRGSEKVNMMRCCEDLLSELSRRDESWPFQAPVTRRDAPDYFSVIKRPMDFGTIRKKLFEVEYATPEECITDLRLVFSNCALYNMPQAPEFVAGQKLSRFLEKRIKELGLESKSSGVNSPKSGGRSKKN